jgi:hypothetical protein
MGYFLPVSLSAKILYNRSVTDKGGRMDKSEIVKEALAKYPNMQNMTLAKKIYKENPLLFTTLEAVRASIRVYKGASGKKALKNLTDSTYLQPDKLATKLEMPDPVDCEPYEHYTIHAKCALLIGDVHIPFHDKVAISIMVDYCKQYDIDALIIDGDFADCFEISSFDVEPNVIKFKDEIEAVKQMLKYLKQEFPNAKIYYKFGNHEKRFESYMIKKAPELFGLEFFNLETIFDLFNLGVQHIKDNKIINLSGLAIIHGHEYKGGITSPANPARTTFLRAKSTALSAHNHQTSEHSEPTINGELISCWSIGCLCNLHPAYMPENKWNHGFAIYRKHDETFWHIENKKIISGHVV